MADCILQLKKICKSFDKLQVLHDVDFELRQGEIHALLGKNGSGKTVLMNILYGIQSMDSGEILFEGMPVKIKSPQQAGRLGIAMLSQEILLYTNTDIAHNIWTNHEPKYLSFIDRSNLYARTQKLLSELGIPLSAHDNIDTLGLAERQLVQVLRILAANPRVVILDEPTEVLDNRYRELFLELLLKMKQQGISIIYITHKLDEVTQICDRASIMKNCTITEVVSIAECDFDGLVAKLFGIIQTSSYPKLQIKLGDELLRVSNLSYANILHDISFTLRRGEILGLAGAAGSGRSTLAKTLYGALTPDKGDIYISSTDKIHIRSPYHAVRCGIGYISNDFQNGLFQTRDISFNISLSNLRPYQKFCFVSPELVENVGRNYIDKLNIKVYDISIPVDYLSGGNQQKVVVGKCANTYSSIVIMDEPSAGMDLAGKGDLYNIMNEFVRNNAGILFISSDISELLGMCDRILTLCNGRITHQFYRETVTANELFECVTADT
ncbi:MAG: sugar ABC transporter ATP-binding protein [Eubacteriales bacterium]|nr:sugar ABC transporter ATP-binding protein [Eubacteriales bacterium]